MYRMRFPLTIIAGIICVIAISLGAIVTAGKADEGLRHVLYAVILAMAAPTVTTLLSLLKSEKNAEKIDHNTEQAKHDAGEIARNLEAATEEVKRSKEEIARNLAAAKEELQRSKEEFLRELKGTRNDVSLAAQANAQAITRSDAAIARGEKAYTEANGVNRKLSELRSEVFPHLSDAVHEVDDKVVAVDEKVTEIKKRVEHEGKA